MAGYSFGEQVGMTFAYGRAGGSGHDAFPDRKQPKLQIFAAVYRRLAETETSVPVSANRERAIVPRTAGQEEHMLELVAGDPGISMRQLAVAIPVGCVTV